DPRRRADPASLHDAKIAAFAAELLVHDQEPVHALALRAQKFGALPARKCRQRRMRGSTNEIDGAVAQRRVALVDGIDQLERDIQAFPREATELDRGDRGEVRVRDHVGHGEFHVSNSGFLKRHEGMTIHRLAASSRATRARPAYSWRPRRVVRLTGACRVRSTRSSPPSRLGARAPAASGQGHSRAMAAAASAAAGQVVPRSPWRAPWTPASGPPTAPRLA